jgi:hypothetical protein
MFQVVLVTNGDTAQLLQLLQRPSLMRHLFQQVPLYRMCPTGHTIFHQPALDQVRMIV